MIQRIVGTSGVFATGAVLAFGVQAVSARILELHAYGTFVYAFAWIGILAHLARLGFHSGLVRFVSTYRATGEWPMLKGVVVRSVQLVGGTSLVLATCLGISVSFFSQEIGRNQMIAFWAGSTLLVPLALLGVTQGILQGYEQPARSLIPIRPLFHGSTLVILILGATAGLIDSSADAMLAAAIGAAIALTVGLAWVVQAIHREVHKVQARYQTISWLRVSAPLLFMASTHLIMKQTDTVLLGIVSGASSAGRYYPAARIAELSGLGVIAVNAFVAPLITRMYQSGEFQELKRTICAGAVLGMAVTVMAAVTMWAIGGWILGIFGPTFVSGWSALMILIGGQLINAACGPADFALTMTYLQDRASLILALAAVVNIVLNAMLIPALGINGAALATAISFAMWKVCMAIEAQRCLGFNTTIFNRRAFGEVTSLVRRAN